MVLPPEATVQSDAKGTMPNGDPPYKVLDTDALGMTMAAHPAGASTGTQGDEAQQQPTSPTDHQRAGNDATDMPSLSESAKVMNCVVPVMRGSDKCVLGRRGNAARSGWPAFGSNSSRAGFSA